MSKDQEEEDREKFNFEIYARSRAGDPQRAEDELQKMMLAGVKPDQVSFNLVIGVNARNGDPQRAADWAARMIEEGVEPNDVTYGTVAEAWMRAKQPRKAEEWLKAMILAGLVPTQSSYLKLVDEFEKDGEDERAALWREQMDSVEGEAKLDPFSALLQARDCWRSVRDPPETRRKPGCDREARPRPGEGLLHQRQKDEEELEAPEKPFGDAIRRCAENGDPERAASWFHKMVEAGFAPAPEAHSAIIKAFCAKDNTSEAQAWLVRALQSRVPLGQETLRTVLAGHLSAGDMVAGMVTLDLAERRGHKLEAPTYNVLLRGLVWREKGASEVEKWVKRMQSRLVKPDANTYALLILSFIREGNVTFATQWFDRAGEFFAGYSHTELEAACARRGGEQLEQWVRGSSLPDLPDAQILGALLATAKFEGDDDQEAELALEQRLAEDLEEMPEAEQAESLAAAAASALRRADFPMAALWLERACAGGFEPEIGLLRKAADGLLNASDAFGAENLLRAALGAGAKPYDLVPLCGSVARSLARRSNAEPALQWVDWLLDRGIRLRTGDMAQVVVKLAYQGNVRRAALLLERLRKEGRNCSRVATRMVIGGYSKLGEPKEAERWFKHLSSEWGRADRRSGALVVEAWAKAGNVTKAEAWLSYLRKARLDELSVTYCSVIHAHAQRGNANGATHWLTEMKNANLQADEAIYNALIDSWAKQGNVQRAQYWMGRMRQLNLKPNEITFGSLVHACAKAGDPAQAERWLDRMLKNKLRPSNVVYNSVISANARANKSDEAGGWLERMRGVGLAPDLVSFNTVINACARRGDFEGAAGWLKRMKAEGLKPDRVSYNTVVSACARAARPDEAVRWVERMVADGAGEPNVRTWSSLIAAYAATKPPQSEQAEAAFRRMVGAGVQPDRPSKGALARAVGSDRCNEICSELCVDDARAVKARRWLPQE